MGCGICIHLVAARVGNYLLVSIQYGNVCVGCTQRRLAVSDDYAVVHGLRFGSGSIVEAVMVEG